MYSAEFSEFFRRAWAASMLAIRAEVEQRARAIYWDVWPPAPYGTLGEDIPRPMPSWKHWSRP